MAVANKIRKAAKVLSPVCRGKHLPVWVRLTSLISTLALAGSIALGMPLHSSDRGCNVPMEMENCDMGMPPAPGMTATALCCLLNCQEQGPTGTVFSVQSPSASATPHVALSQPFAPKPLPQTAWLQSSSFTPPETYLKNLALLI